MRRAGFPLLLLILALARPAAAAGEAEALARLFQAPRLESAWFSAEMLQAAPLPQIEAYRDQLVATHGPFQGAVPLGETWQVRLERALLPATIALDSEGRVAALWLGHPVALDRTLEEVGGDVASLPGAASLLLRRDGAVLVAWEAERDLAVGSAFKLAVLAALQNSLQTTSLRWDEVLRLEGGHRSLPTGQLQDWPLGAPLTLHSLAALMISASDNTATDALIDYLGVERIEPLLPPASRPLLTTRQYFILGGAAHAEERARYLRADEAGRRAILVGLRNSAPSLADFLAGGAGPEFGWHLSAAALCDLMDDLVGLDVLAINPGLATPNGWKKIGFKGGSTFGAINMTTGLLAHDGRRFCLSMTWNDAAGVEVERFSQLYAELLALAPRE